MNVLLDLHRQAAAEFQPYDQIEIVSTFGEPQAEYAAIRKGCGMMDLPQRGLLELTGADRLPFLNNLITNQVWDKQNKSGLSPGQSIYAFLLDAKSGRIVADMNVIEVPVDRTLLEMDIRFIAPVKAILERYQFAERVTFTDRSESLHEIALHGSLAIDILGERQPDDAIIWRDDACGVPGHHLIVPSDSARRMWMELLSGFATPDRAGKRRLRPVGWAAFNACRIEAGRPLFGIDFDQSLLPAETGQLDRAVSFTKGCYPGQEIVARMHARGQLARRIAGIRMDSGALPIAGEKVFDDQSNEIGAITSSTVSPVLSNAAICLALLKRPYFEVGKIVHAPAEGAMRPGKTVALPFVQAA